MSNVISSILNYAGSLLWGDASTSSNEAQEEVQVSYIRSNIPEHKMPFEKLRVFFVQERDRNAREEFTRIWKKEFDSLPQWMQAAIIIKQVEYREKLRDENLTEVQIVRYAKVVYQEEAARTLQYVRNLEIFVRGNNTWDPCHDSQVPRMLS